MNKQIMQAVTALKPDERIMVLAPVVPGARTNTRKNWRCTRRRVTCGRMWMASSSVWTSRSHSIVARIIRRNSGGPTAAEKRNRATAGTINQNALKLTDGLVTITVVGGEETSVRRNSRARNADFGCEAETHGV